jgi:N-acetylneuraminic acid mutarotase
MKNFPRLAGRLLALLLVLGSLGLSSCKKDDTTTVYGNWVKGNSFPGTVRSNSVSFVVNGVAYVGTGIDANSVKYNDFFSFNPATGSWLQCRRLRSGQFWLRRHWLRRYQLPA